MGLGRGKGKRVVSGQGLMKKINFTKIQTILTKTLKIPSEDLANIVHRLNKNVKQNTLRPIEQSNQHCNTKKGHNSTNSSQNQTLLSQRQV